MRSEKISTVIYHRSLRPICNSICDLIIVMFIGIPHKEKLGYDLS